MVDTKSKVAASTRKLGRLFVAISLAPVMVPSLFAMQQGGGLETQKTKSTMASRSIGQAASVNSGQFEIEAGHGGRLHCILRVTLEEGNPWIIKTAEYAFDVPADGLAHSFDFGPKVPIQTTVNNVISTQFLNRGTTVATRARLVRNIEERASPSTAWFELHIEYSRVLERVATFASLPSAPYVETNNLNTYVLLGKDSEQELYAYDDSVIGRKLRITFKWAIETAPDSSRDLLAPAGFNTLRCTLTLADSKRSVTQSFLMTTPSPYYAPGSYGIRTFTSGGSGVSIPVETDINQTKSIEYIWPRIGADFDPVNIIAPSGKSEETIIEFPFHVHYARLQERTFVTKAETPYSDQVNFDVDVTLREGQKRTIFSVNEPIRGGRTFTATFDWRRGAP